MRMAITGILFIILGSCGAYEYVNGRANILIMFGSAFLAIIGLTLIAISIFSF